MAKKKVTKKKIRSASGHKATSAGTRSKKTKKPATTAKKHAKTTKKSTKTTKKSVAKVVAKKPAKKSAKPATRPAKQTAKKVPTKTSKKKPVTLSAAKTSRTKKKVTTTASATSRKTSSKAATRPRSRSSAKRPSPDANGYVIINGRRVRMMAVAANPVPVVTKRTRRVKATAVSEPIGTKKTIKTKLGRKELNEYRTQLLIQRAELVGDLTAMEAQALRSGSGNPSHMPIHMADVGTDTFDQDFMLGMAETERRRLREIDAALKRIEDRTYGVCEMSGKTIPKARLNAKPWARYTIESARKIERGQSE